MAPRHPSGKTRLSRIGTVLTAMGLLAAGAVVTFTPPASVAAGVAARPFKGVAGPACGDVTRLNLSWYYNWWISPGSCTAPGFMPMISGKSEKTAGDVGWALDQARKGGYGTVLAFNEPNKRDQANMTVEQATGGLSALSFDPNKGTLDGSPLDHLPDNIRLLDIQLPNGAAPMRADWSPDGKRLVFLDAPTGDLWQYDLATGATRNLTESFVVHRGVLRAHHLTNGDLVMCALSERSDDPEGDRFRGELWVLQRPLGTRAPVPLGERCWEGIAVSMKPGSTRIAWNQSTIDFTKPNVIIEALFGESKILTGRIVYRDDRPMISDRTVILDKRDVSLDTPAVEAQDFRSLPDRDADPDDELIFTAYFRKGGQAMGVNLDTGAVTDYAPSSLFYEEPEGIDPAGRYLLVERDLAITLFPGQVDIWRLSLDGSGAFERMTTFNYYKGFGANNPVVSPDGTQVAFGLKVEGEEGEGRGILLMDLTR